MPGDQQTDRSIDRTGPRVERSRTPAETEPRLTSRRTFLRAATATGAVLGGVVGASRRAAGSHGEAAFGDVWTEPGVTHEWRTVDLLFGFDGPPVVLAAMQTFNGGNTAETRIRDLATGEFSVKIEEERTGDAETAHIGETVGFVTLDHTGPGASTIADRDGARIGWVARIARAQPSGEVWHRVELPDFLDDPVVFLQVLTFRGAQAVHPRLTDVGSERLERDHSFFFKLEEWTDPGRARTAHIREDVGIVAVERGHHPLHEFPEDGPLALEAGRVSGIDHTWGAVGFASSFRGPPVVVSQCQTFNGGQAVVTRQRDLTEDGLALRLQEAEARGRHTTEQVGYLAVDRNPVLF